MATSSAAMAGLTDYRFRRKRPDGPIRFRSTFRNTIWDVMATRGWLQTTDPENPLEWDFAWEERCDLFEYYDSHHLQSWQRINHFRNTRELCRKDLLVKNVKKARREHMKATGNADFYDFVPLSFSIPSEYGLFVEEFKRQPGSVWIAKPCGRSQGQGIFLFDRLASIAHLKSDAAGRGHTQSAAPSGTDSEEEGPPETFVVQRYIANPYLIGGRKFDMRIYVMVTSFSPLTVYLYRDAFCRLTSVRYDPTKLNDVFAHLTNVAIQKTSASYNAETGGKLEMGRLKSFILARHGADACAKTFNRIQEIILLALKSVEKLMYKDKHAFELYGYDIMLDSELRPWLLEVNASPSLTANTEDDYKLKCRMLNDMLDLVDMEGRLQACGYPPIPPRMGGFDLIYSCGQTITPPDVAAFHDVPNADTMADKLKQGMEGEENSPELLPHTPSGTASYNNLVLSNVPVSDVNRPAAHTVRLNTALGMDWDRSPNAFVEVPPEERHSWPPLNAAGLPKPRTGTSSGSRRQAQDASTDVQAGIPKQGLAKFTSAAHQAASVSRLAAAGARSRPRTVPATTRASAGGPGMPTTPIRLSTVTPCLDVPYVQVETGSAPRIQESHLPPLFPSRPEARTPTSTAGSAAPSAPGTDLEDSCTSPFPFLRGTDRTRTDRAGAGGLGDDLEATEVKVREWVDDPCIAALLPPWPKVPSALKASQVSDSLGTSSSSLISLNKGGASYAAAAMLEAEMAGARHRIARRVLSSTGGVAGGGGHSRDVLGGFPPAGTGGVDPSPTGRTHLPPQSPIARPAPAATVVNISASGSLTPLRVAAAVSPSSSAPGTTTNTASRHSSTENSKKQRRAAASAALSLLGNRIG